ncbi:cupin domain-containing protein [Thermococcus argininiproducens]|uniref:Cupin domain-containing protein n=1 Tax=Thermococcus argininiproducens TaxID=2866384 RepID=A0A9E7MA47_9EURY|nr:cupin domain-containing protein [Thermococcus argininiproducens]USH00180.1 cupin domain-containing protein [Thermococcus argininiproducens]
MIVVKVEDAEKFENPHGVDVKKLIGMENVQILHVTLKPGEGLKKHTAPVDAFLYVIKGKGMVEVGEEKEEVRKATLVYLPREVPHSVENTGSLEMKFLVIKVR